MRYEGIDPWEKLKEKSLQPKENFFSSLHNKGTSDRNYKHTLRVWNTDMF